MPCRYFSNITIPSIYTYFDELERSISRPTTEPACQYKKEVTVYENRYKKAVNKEND
jgi:hypothetical protein